MIVQMTGIVAAQGLLVLGDPSGFVLFVIPSVLVSLSFAPILLSISPRRPSTGCQADEPARLYQASPLGCVGMVLMGGVFAAQFGMAAVYATRSGLSVLRRYRRCRGVLCRRAGAAISHRLSRTGWTAGF